MSVFLATAVIAVLTTFGGLWVASRSPKWLTQDTISELVAFGTGLLLALAFLEFLPHSLEHSPHLGGLLILAGVLLILMTEIFIVPRLHFLDRLVLQEDGHHAHDHVCGDDHHPHHPHHGHLVTKEAACSAIGCLAVCAFFDGVQIKAAFTLGTSAGLLTSLGLLFHVLPDGIIAASLALSSGFSKRAAKFTSLLIGGSLFAGLLAGHFLTSITEGLHIVLPLATGLLLHVSFVHLLPASTRSKRGPYYLFAGIAIFALLISVAPH